MPVEVVTVAKKPVRRAHYAMVSQSNYGRMDSTMPFRGLATFGLSLCVGIVGHCAELSRTILVHTIIKMDVKSAMEPILDWIIGKGNEELYKTTNSIEVYIIHGYDSAQSSLFINHYAEFKDDITQFVHENYVNHSVSVNDTFRVNKHSNGSLLVDKGTGKISLLTSPVSLEVMCNSTKYTMKQVFRDYFATDILPRPHTNDTLATKRHLQFDVNKYNVHEPISDECRLVFRGMLSSFPDTRMRNLFEEIHIDPELYDVVKLMLINVMEGLPCEICAEDGVLKCSGCKGAYYCTKEHQRTDWPVHKRFCRLYPFSQAS